MKELAPLKKQTRRRKQFVIREKGTSKIKGEQKGDIPERDMYNTFNMGIGMVLAVPAEQEQKALDILRAAGEDANIIGIVAKGSYGVAINAPPMEIIE